MTRRIELACIRDKKGEILVYSLGKDDGEVLAFYQGISPGAYESKAFVETVLTDEQIKGNISNALAESID